MKSSTMTNVVRVFSWRLKQTGEIFPFRGCRKKHKSFEPQRHKDTKEDFLLFDARSAGKPKKTLCLCVFVVPFFSEPFATPSFARAVRGGITATWKRRRYFSAPNSYRPSQGNGSLLLLSQPGNCLFNLGQKVGVGDFALVHIKVVVKARYRNGCPDISTEKARRIRSGCQHRGGTARAG